MRHFYIFLLTFFVTVTAHSQGPRVPNTIDFAGMKLHLNDKAKREIQTDVDNLTRSEKYFRRKVEKIDLHFPIIERIFKEEKLPDDFKYLVIQESALVSDAVSTSNAVGFWQFKKETGLEMGLRIDNMVDERLNLVSSSRAAARYLKKNNFYFDNWVYALLAYNTGLGGAEKYISEKDFGKKRMDITGKTHWYVKKFLAHKIAYQGEVGKAEGLPFFLFEYTSGGGRSLKDVSKEFEVEEELLGEYNKCYKRKKIPDDKVYSVLVPIGFDKADMIAKKSDDIYKGNNRSGTRQSIFSIGKNGSQVKNYYSAANEFPKIENTDDKGVFEINHKKGTIAQPGDNFDMMAVRGGISLDKFMDYNDLTEYDKVQSGQVYYFKRKYSKAKTHYHILLPGQTLWEVSQKYGVKLKKLLTKNRLEDEGGAKAGLVLWLRYIRPKNISPEFHDVRHLKNEQEPFADESITKNEEPVKSEPIEQEQEDIFFEDESPSVTVPESKTDHIEVFADSEEDREERKKILAAEVEEIEEESTSVSTKTIMHEVKKGETYFAISNSYKVDISDLLNWNNLQINDVLSIGQKLVVKIPEQSEQEVVVAKAEVKNSGNTVIHKVSKTDTLYGIAKKYQVTIKEIMEWNDKEDFVIEPDEELKIMLK